MTKKEIFYIVGLILLYVLIDGALFSYLPDTTFIQILSSLVIILLVGGVGLYMLQKLKNKE